MNTNGSKAFSWVNNSTGRFVAGVPVRARVRTGVKKFKMDASTGVRACYVYDIGSVRTRSKNYHKEKSNTPKTVYVTKYRK